MVVKEYQTSKGVTIRFHDTAYADKTESEKEKLRQQVNKNINIIMQRGTYETRDKILP